METYDPEEELKKLRSENAELRQKLQLFYTEHRILGWASGLIFFGPRLVDSIRNWLLKATYSNPIPTNETAEVAAAIIRRIVRAGTIGLLFPASILIWQNCIMIEQNRYFREQTTELRKQITIQGEQSDLLREQTAELRKQIAIQDEQSDLLRRSELIEAVYNGKQNGLSTRARVEALKALVKLDNKLIDQGKLLGPLVNLRGIDFSCTQPRAADCADLSEAWLVRTDFTGSSFRGAKLLFANLRESVLVSSDLSDADLSFADLESTMLRELVSAPFRTGIQNESPTWIPDVEGFADKKVILINEIRRIIAPYRIEDPREDMIFSEFVLEREATSPALKTFLNKATNAVIITNAKFNIASSKEGFENIDLYTRIPLGIAFDHYDRTPPWMKEKSLSLIEQKKIFDKIDLIQTRADELFGRYQVDIDLLSDPGRKGRTITNGLVCRRSGLLGGDGHGISYYEALSPSAQEDYLRKFCDFKFKPRRRGGLAFPG